MQQKRLSRHDILRAFADGRFEPFYQPVHEARTGRLAGAEILARLRLPDGTVCPPDSFIPLLFPGTETAELARILLDRTRYWLTDVRLPGTFIFSFNITAEDVASASLLASCQQLLNATSRQVCLTAELTETVPVPADSSLFFTGLRRLLKCGVVVALDDFGTGYSGPGLLLQTGATQIKIPREFISTMQDSGVARAIIDSILFLAERLGLQVTAEGVEDNVQLSVLQGKKVRWVQGYYFSPPLSQTDFIAYAAQQR